MKLALKTASLLVTLALTAPLLHAMPPAPLKPVSWVLATQHNDNFDDRRVTLIGHVTHPDNGSDWWFTDGTGRVRLETGDTMLPVGPLLRVTGRIDQATWGIGVIEVKVHHWTYANAR